MICTNLANIQQEITRVAEGCGRNPKDIHLLAVSKRKDVEQIQEAWSCGQKLFGENFVQEAQDKIERLDPSINWHFIGHLQTNKAKSAVQLFQLIETVDRFKLAKVLDRHAGEIEKLLDILVQVNIGGEQQKSGVQPENAEQLVKEINQLKNIRIRGLMTMPPFSKNPESSRPYFKTLKIMADEFSQKGYFSKDCPVIISMGMSADYTIAIEEGATLVRVGTAIFGKRA